MIPGLEPKAWPALTFPLLGSAGVVAQAALAEQDEEALEGLDALEELDSLPPLGPTLAAVRYAHIYLLFVVRLDLAPIRLLTCLVRPVVQRQGPPQRSSWLSQPAAGQPLSSALWHRLYLAWQGGGAASSRGILLKL